MRNCCTINLPCVYLYLHTGFHCMATNYAVLFSVGGVWLKLPSRFRNATKGVACVQTSVLLMYTYVSLSFPALSRCWWSHCCNVKMAENCDKSDEERARRLARKRTEDSQNEATILRSMSMREERRLAKQRKHMAVLRNDHIYLAHFFELFQHNALPSSHFVTHGRPSQKHVPCLLTVMRKCQFKGYI